MKPTHHPNSSQGPQMTMRPQHSSPLPSLLPTPPSLKMEETLMEGVTVNPKEEADKLLVEVLRSMSMHMSLPPVPRRSAWYAPTPGSNPTAPPSYVPSPDASPIPTPMYDQGINQVLYRGGAPNPATYTDGYGSSQLRWYQLGHDPRHCYIIFIPTTPGGPLTPTPEYTFIP
jgi:hypothetical protein